MGGYEPRDRALSARDAGCRRGAFEAAVGDGAVRVWLATGHTDMRRGFAGLALLVQETLKAVPNSGHMFVIRGSCWKQASGMVAATS